MRQQILFHTYRNYNANRANPQHVAFIHMFPLLSRAEIQRALIVNNNNLNQTVGLFYVIFII